MVNSVNQPRPAVRSSGGLFRVIGILALIVISVAWLLNSYKAGQPIALSQPLPKGVDPIVSQSISFDIPIRCIDTSAPIVQMPGRTALTAPSNYVDCSGSVKADYTAVKGADGYTITDADGDKFLCGGIPVEASDLTQCKAAQ